MFSLSSFTIVIVVSVITIFIFVIIIIILLRYLQMTKTNIKWLLHNDTELMIPLTKIRAGVYA